MTAAMTPCRALRRRSAPPKKPGRQRGQVLLLLLLALVTGAAYLLVQSLNAGSIATERDRITQQALAEAKEGLIAYLLRHYEEYPGEFGFLPCPDMSESGATEEGISHGSCGAKNVSAIGRYPWKSLKLPPIRDGYGECLWYAVSGSYKHVNALTKTDMLNEDTSGLFQIYAADGSTLLTGNLPTTRAVAVIFAPGYRLSGQYRTLVTGAEICGGNYGVHNYLESAFGKDNASLPTSPDTIHAFITGDVKDVSGNAVVNDRIAYITSDELFAAVRKRNDFASKMNSLAQAVTQCVAQYGKNNPGFPGGDKRLPWPAPVEMSDYRINTNYDDKDTVLSGRIPDIVDTSNLQTGQTSSGLISTCLSSEQKTLWSHWKDHFFYAIAKAHAPDASTPTPSCTAANCLKANGSGNYAAIVFFTGSRLTGQTRDAPPTDTDTKRFIDNYLEGKNASNHPNASGNSDYETGFVSDTFNDILYCVKDDLTVVSCP